MPCTLVFFVRASPPPQSARSSPAVYIRSNQKHLMMTVAIARQVSELKTKRLSSHLSSSTFFSFSTSFFPSLVMALPREAAAMLLWQADELRCCSSIGGDEEALLGRMAPTGPRRCCTHAYRTPLSCTCSSCTHLSSPHTCVIFGEKDR